jgi:hypothetical protein
MSRRGLRRRPQVGGAEHARRAAEPCRPAQPAALPPRLLTPGHVLQLQATAGNRAVAGLLAAPAVAVQRTIYTFTDGKWQAGDPSGDDRYQDPDKITWSPVPKEGDTYDRSTGKVTRGTATDHVFTRVANSKKKAFGGWYGKQRQPTAYAFTTGTGDQGPHTFAHVGKRAMAEASTVSNTGFDPTAVNPRSGILPSPGQARRLLSEYEKATDTKIDKKRKVELDVAYKQALKERATGKTKKARLDATVRAMELNPLATYSHGTVASKGEIAGKGEKRDKAVADLVVLGGLKKGELPTGLSVYDPGAAKFPSARMSKYLRDIGRVAQGYEDLSDMEADSDEEYSDDEKPEPEPEVSTPDGTPDVTAGPKDDEDKDGPPLAVNA